MSQMDCSQFENLYECALIVIANAEKLRDWVNGDEQTDVELGGEMTPTIRKLVATIDARESEAARLVIQKGIQDITAIKEQATDAAQEAKDAAQEAKSIVGTGKCPIVTRQIQAADQASGTDVVTPAYFPMADGIHVYYDGVLLSSGVHYQEKTPIAPSEQSLAITALFDVEAGAEWEFHTWDHVRDSADTEEGVA